MMLKLPKLGTKKGIKRTNIDPDVLRLTIILIIVSIFVFIM